MMDILFLMCVFMCIVEIGSFMCVFDMIGFIMLCVLVLLSVFEQYFGCWLLNCIMWCILLIEDGQVYYECFVVVLCEIDDMEVLVLQVCNVLCGWLKVNLLFVMVKQVVVFVLLVFFDVYLDIMFEFGVIDWQIDFVGEGVDCVVCIGVFDDLGMIVKWIGSLIICMCGLFVYFVWCGELQIVDDFVQYVVVSYILVDIGWFCLWDYVVDGELCIVQMCGMVVVNDVDNYIECGVVGIGLIKMLLYFVELYLKLGWLCEVLIDFNVLVWLILVLYLFNCYILVKLKVFVDWFVGLFEQILMLQGKCG